MKKQTPMNNPFLRKMKGKYSAERYVKFFEMVNKGLMEQAKELDQQLSMKKSEV